MDKKELYFFRTMFYTLGEALVPMQASVHPQMYLPIKKKKMKASHEENTLALYLVFTINKKLTVHYSFLKRSCFCISHFSILVCQIFNEREDEVTQLFRSQILSVIEYEN